MKILKLLLLLLLFSSIYYGCVSGSCISGTCTSDECAKLLNGSYKYTMMDTLENKLVEGIINFKDYDENKISGTYTKVKLTTDDLPGYSSMQGSFSGSVDVKEKKGFVNTNPKLADYNVFFRFEIKKDSLIGAWSLSTMRGIQNHGNFYAIKKIK